MESSMDFLHPSLTVRVRSNNTYLLIYATVVEGLPSILLETAQSLWEDLLFLEDCPLGI